MKLDASKLGDFIKSVSMKGVIRGGTFHVSESGIRCILQNGNTLAVEGHLNMKLTNEFELNIKNTKFLISLLESFTGITDLTVEENRFLLSNPTSEAEITMADSEFVKEYNLDSLPPDLKFSKVIKIDAEVFEQVLKNYSLMNTQSVFLWIKDKELKIISGEEGFDKLKVKMKCPNITEEIKIELGKQFIDAVSSLGGFMELHLEKSDWPVKLVKKTEFSTITALIAPYVSTEEREGE